MTFGPSPIGTWSNQKAPNCGFSYKFLHLGERYKVIKEFVDYDHSLHPAGEEWSFLGYSFLPYEDGMSLFVSFDGQQEWHIRLQWRDEEQGHVLNQLDEYIHTLREPVG